MTETTLPTVPTPIAQTSVLKIDSREARMHPQTVALLRRRLPYVEILETLRFGDYVFTSTQPHPTTGTCPTVAIELCTVNDLVGKIDSGRFAFQLSGMLEMYDRCILMICGPITADAQGFIRMGGPARVQYERVASALFSASCHGIIVEHAQSADSDHVASRIVHNYTYWNKPYDEHKMFRQVPILIDNTSIPLSAAIDPRLGVLMGVPGIGEDRAASLLRASGSLAAAFMMIEEDIQKIPGWGKKLAKQFNDFAWRSH